MLIQPTLAWLVADFLIIYGALLVVMGCVVWPFEYVYKKKHGPLPQHVKALLYIGLFAGSLVIAIPGTAVYRTMGRRSPPSYITNLNLNPSNPVQPATSGSSSALTAAQRDAQRLEQQAQQQREHEAQARVQQLAEQRQQEMAAARARQQAEHERRVAQIRAEAEKRRQAHEQRMAEAKARREAQKKQREEMQAMREADVYKPPAGSTTPEQLALDKQIIDANEQLQELKKEKQRLETLRDEASAAVREIMQQRPIDRPKLNAMQKQLHESARGVAPLAGEIMRKRMAVTKLLQERYKLVEPAVTDPPADQN